MEVFTFSALGTQWSVSVDGVRLREDTQKALLNYAHTFEQRFSRFLLESESNAFREAAPGTYPVSFELAELLEMAEKLRKITEGRYDPGVGKLMEHAGYDQQYRLHPDNDELERFRLPQWSLQGQEVTLDAPVVFDFGGIGKGYCIDRLADILRREGYLYFLVEGGGDMFGTTKPDGSSFRIALEWPGRPETAFGVLDLRTQGVAVSDTFKRRWGKWHHVLDPEKKEPIESVVGAAAIAPNAFWADCMTSGLFLARPEKYQELVSAFEAAFVIFKKEGRVVASEHWPGELF